VIIQVETGQSLRDIALQYLGDHSLAHRIAQLNNLASVREIPRPGMMLEVGEPVPELRPVTRWFVKNDRNVATAPKPRLIGVFVIGLDKIQ